MEGPSTLSTNLDWRLEGAPSVPISSAPNITSSGPIQAQKKKSRGVRGGRRVQKSKAVIGTESLTSVELISLRTRLECLIGV